MWISTSLRTPHLHETRALAEPGAFRGNRPPIQSLEWCLVRAPWYSVPSFGQYECSIDGMTDTGPLNR